MSETIKYTSDNGYTGLIYGKKSLSIFYNHKEVFHTSSRRVESYEELVNMVDDFPNFMKLLGGENI